MIVKLIVILHIIVAATIFFQDLNNELVGAMMATTPTLSPDTHAVLPPRHHQASLNSLATWLFVQQLVQPNNIEYFKAMHY